MSKLFDIKFVYTIMYSNQFTIRDIGNELSKAWITLYLY